jgi:DivIVA domain-containing protein
VDLEQQRFRRTRPGAEGYDKHEVDRFVAEICEAMRHDPPTMAPWEVRDKRFQVGRVHRGYVERDVDDFLDLAEELLATAHGLPIARSEEESPTRPGRPPAALVLLLAVAAVVCAAAYALVG